MTTTDVRSRLSGICFALGTVWAVAGAMKAIFGVAITFPLLPPLALDRVDVTRSFIAALVWCLAGAVIGRSASLRGGAGRDARERAL